MKLDEITAKGFKDELKHGPQYRVYVLSKLGKYYEGEGLSYDEAKYLLNDLVGEAQSDVFPQDPGADMRWAKDGESAVLTIPSYRKGEEDRKVEYGMERDNRK